jgi:dethiobiotin synthetase
MTRGFFITGTDTGAGKTYATCCLLHAFSARGLRALGMKPVASGSELQNGEFRNEDALLLQAASTIDVPYALINPYALREPTAPEIAARLDGATIALSAIQSAYAELAAQADIVLVEGVGGWLAPITEQIDQADIPRTLDLSVILVVGLKLGCLNHARLSVEAIRSRGFQLAGWLCSDVDPNLRFSEDYFAALERVMDAPLIGRIGHAHQQPELNISALFA